MRVLLKATIAILTTLLLGSASSRAGSATYDLNTDPGALIKFVGSAEWVSTGGVGDSGHIKLIDNTGQSCAVLFPDFEPGFVVGAFTFECQIKCGDWYNNPPADGFSVNFANASDPIIGIIDGGENPGRGGRTDGWAGSQDLGGNENNLPEEGTQTGIAIGFDTWGTGTAPVGGSNGPQDVRGISVRVGGVLVHQEAMPNVLFAQDYDFVSDCTTLITGPFSCGPSPTNPNVGDPDCNGGSPPSPGTLLKWVPLKVDVRADGTLNVFWKGCNILKDFKSTYGPAPGRIVFGASTGGAEQYTGIDDIKITTEPVANAIFTRVVANRFADGFVAEVNDSGQSVFDATSPGAALVFKLDNQDITPTSITKTGGLTSLAYTLPGGAVFESGSAHTVEVQGKDTAGTPITGGVKSFNAPTFNTIGAAQAVTGVDKSKRGFLVKPVQSYHGYDNNNDHSERQIFGEAGRNVADLSQTGPDGNPIRPDGYYVEPGVINYDANPAGPGSNGNFTPDNAMPGQPSIVPDLKENPIDNDALEIITYIEFTKSGFYTMGVNSDDGFRTSVTRNPKDRFQIDAVRLGEFNGGRGASDTQFTFRVADPGIYLFRTTWENGTGGVNIEWFSVDETGTRHLLNDTANDPEAWPTYYAGPVAKRAYIQKIRPGVRSSQAAPGVAAQGNGVVIGKPGDPLVVEIADADTKVVEGSVKLTVNGTDVTANSTIAKAGGVTTVTWSPPGGLALLTDYDCVLTYDEGGSPVVTRTQAWNTRIYDEVMPSDLPANSFVIEAEDFDHDNGQAEAAANDPNYTGGAYAGLSAVLGVDYRNGDNPADCGTPYRNGGPIDVLGSSVSHDSITGGRFSVERPGGREMTINHKIGWVGSGDWGNYTRTIPAGVYTAYAAQSFDGHGFAQLNGRLGLVTAGAGTANQTVKELGIIDARGSGGWGRNDLVALASPVGKRGYFKLPGGKVTLRYAFNSGDFDWFALAPATGVGPQVIAASPGSGELVFRNHPITAEIQDFDTSAATIKLLIDGAEVNATIGPKVGDITKVSYTPSGANLLTPGVHTYTITITDSAGKTDSANVRFNVYDLDATGAFAIEAEDFNYDGGKTKPEASVMPYFGGAYNGLGAVEGIDYNNDDDNSSNVYRTEKPDTGADENEVNINDNLGGRLGRERGAWVVTTNYKIGWVGGPNEWYNYTRTFPAATYKVYAALSFDGTAASQLKGFLERVTSDPTKPNQTVELLGYFDAPGTQAVGGWGANELVPMRDAATGGNLKTVALDGTQTLRFNSQSGDYDYLLLVPGEGILPPPKFTSITRNAQTGAITVVWEGGGKLEAAASILGPWQEVTEASSPYTFTPNPAQPILFGRIRR
jgi:hypothetical protein